VLYRFSIWNLGGLCYNYYWAREIGLSTRRKYQIHSHSVAGPAIAGVRVIRVGLRHAMVFSGCQLVVNGGIQRQPQWSLADTGTCGTRKYSDIILPDWRWATIGGELKCKNVLGGSLRKTCRALRRVWILGRTNVDGSQRVGGVLGYQVRRMCCGVLQNMCLETRYCNRW